ncbi:hypothetical protein ACIPVB_03285 [Microbacterium sp. NPDC090007]|uniref:hypothetical protein n=1 Tax=Microbacterium sp. NPDC090007 TaxID=3364204 RepID=UPI0038263936
MAIYACIVTARALDKRRAAPHILFSTAVSAVAAVITLVLLSDPDATFNASSGWIALSSFAGLAFGWAIIICLPDGMSTQPTAATGTVMRPALLHQYATEAGFRDVRVLPVRDFAAFRFDQLLC